MLINWSEFRAIMMAGAGALGLQGEGEGACPTCSRVGFGGTGEQLPVPMGIEEMKPDPAQWGTDERQWAQSKPREVPAGYKERISTVRINKH